jgi:hypothetical protein
MRVRAMSRSVIDMLADFDGGNTIQQLEESWGYDHAGSQAWTAPSSDRSCRVR